MTEDEYKWLKGAVDRITEHQKRLAARARDAEDDFTAVEKRLADLLAAVKKRISDRMGGQRPPLSQ